MKKCKNCEKELSKNKYTLCRNCASLCPKTEEWKRKIGESGKGKHNHIGENNPNWRSGVTKFKTFFCKECSKFFRTIRGNRTICVNCQTRIRNTGIIFTEERKINISKATIGRKPWNIGKPRLDMCSNKNPNWQGGLATLNNLIRTSYFYKKHIKQVMERDNFACKECGKIGGTLHVNHKRPFAVILREKNIRNLEEAIECIELWDLDNLETLCFDCHKKTDTFLSGTIRLIEKLNLK